jgi:adenylate cyclase
VGVSGADVPRPAAGRGDDIAALYRLVGLDDPRYERTELAALAGVDRSRSVKWWRAMGFPEVPAGVRAFGDDDVAMIRRLVAVTGTTPVDDDTILRLARLLGASLSRVAEAQIAALEQLDEAGAPADGRSPADVLARIEPPIVALLTDALVYVWRRHLLAALGRLLHAGEDESECAVAFADLSGFTRLTTRLPSERLAELVDTFEEIAFDAVSAHGGRAVKLIGDEIMYVAPTLDVAVDIALDLAERLDGEPDMPPLHCGIAFGPTIAVGGDVFGAPVNLAARMRDVSRPGTIVVPRAVAGLLAERDDIELVAIRRTFSLKGIGDTRLCAVRRADSAPRRAR